MRIGFHLSYKDNDLGQAAARLARFARSVGHDVAFHTTAARVPPVDPKWDRLVETEADRPFLSWVKDVQVLVALEPVSTTHFGAAARAGCKVVLLAPWDCLREDLKDCYLMADEVVCPGKQAAALLRENWNLRNCRYVPWDTGLPPTRKPDPADPSRVSVLFPLQGWAGGATHPDILNVVWRLLHTHPFADVTLLYGSRGFNTTGYKAIQTMERRFRPTGQFRAVPDRRLTRDETLLAYGRADVVAWAAEQTGLGGVGLDALAMGTPVVAYDVAPQNEFLHDRKNAILVPCELTYNWLGVPLVTPDSAEFEHHLTDLVSRPAALAELRRFTRYGMAARRDRFSAGWSAALGTG